MKDERRAWVPVLVGPDGGIYPIWKAGCLTRALAVHELLQITGYESWDQAYRIGTRMMRCTVEVPARKGKRR